MDGQTIALTVVCCVLGLAVLYILYLSYKDFRYRRRYKKFSLALEKATSGRGRGVPVYEDLENVYGRGHRKGGYVVWHWTSVRRYFKRVTLSAKFDMRGNLTFIFLDERMGKIVPASGDGSMTVDEYLKLSKKERSSISGVFVLYNKTKDMYYVGQGSNVFNLLNNHLTGKDNGDIYADYKAGDDFSISVVSLADSGMKSLDELEKSLIDKYDAFARGYDRSRGNGQDGFSDLDKKVNL